MAPNVRPLRYLTADEVWAMNEALLARESQQALLRDRGVLESAVMRPQTLAHYEGANLIEQAALINGVALAHPFLDGNKRAATIAGAAFLVLNGHRIVSVGDELGSQVEALVLHPDGVETATEQFIVWLRAHVVVCSA